MPKAVGITYAQSREIVRSLLKKGLRVVPKGEDILFQFFYDEKIYQVRPGEVVFRWRSNGYEVLAWSTIDWEKVSLCREQPLLQEEIVSRPPGTDLGWVLVRKLNGQAIYFATCMLRTKNFKDTFVERTLLAQKRIINRPVCEKCGAKMNIMRDVNDGTFWGCLAKNEAHGKGDPPVWVDWDIALTAEERKREEARRKKRKKARKKREEINEEMGKEPPRRAKDIRRERRMKQCFSAA